MFFIPWMVHSCCFFFRFCYDFDLEKLRIPAQANRFEIRLNFTISEYIDKQIQSFWRQNFFKSLNFFSCLKRCQWQPKHQSQRRWIFPLQQYCANPQCQFFRIFPAPFNNFLWYLSMSPSHASEPPLGEGLGQALYLPPSSLPVVVLQHVLLTLCLTPGHHKLNGPKWLKMVWYEKRRV